MGLASSLADKFIAAIPYNNFQATLGIKEVCQNMLDDMPFDISNCCNIAEVVLDEVEVAAAKAPEVKQEGGSND
jgi:ATP-dependent protease Clp ATPase subunit